MHVQELKLSKRLTELLVAKCRAAKPDRARVGSQCVRRACVGGWQVHVPWRCARDSSLPDESGASGAGSRSVT